MSLHVLAWIALSALTGWTWATAPPSPGDALRGSPVRVRKDLVYRTDGGSRCTLDVYLPPATQSPPVGGPRRPAVVAIHGGSWSGGSKRLYRSDPRVPSTVLRMAEAGLVVIAVDYRLARPGSPGWPGVLDDLREAVRWTRRHADEFGLDPDRLVALGQSSGAHLAALLGTLPDLADRDGGTSSRVQAVISFFAPSDLSRLAATRRLAHDPIRPFLGGSADQFLRLAGEASPFRHVSPDDAPMLLLHGTDDLWVPIDQAVHLAGKLQDAGVMHRLIRVEGARHGFEARVEFPSQRDLLPEIFDFLRSVWNVGSE